ncbi:MAG: hypothetical protein IIY45_15345 [Firmicutes bacterium]|jgi:hypothetical protein|nr:hypothetical protein [Bacillota bacterium]MBR3393968.1 hypothetical protein [Bacillota bacterium]
MKLQVFLYNKFGYAQRIADALAEKFTCKCDQIPPAYQCNEEKLIFIVYEKYGSLDKKLVAYMKEMDKKKVQNIAYIEISNTGNEALEEMCNLVKANGVNISGTYGVTIKRSLFSKGQLTEEQMHEVLKFADEQGKANFEFLRKQG